MIVATRRDLKTVLVLQVQRLGALDEIEETCRRVRECFGACRIVIVSSPPTQGFVAQLECVDDVLRMSRWTRPRVLALVRRLRRRGVSDTCIVYDSAASPGPARLELLALAMATPLCYRELGGAVRPLSRARLWARFAADIALALLAAGAGLVAAAVIGAALVISQPLLVRPSRRERRQRRRTRAWNDEWVRRL